MNSTCGGQSRPYATQGKTVHDEAPIVIMEAHSDVKKCMKVVAVNEAKSAVALTVR